MHAYQIWSYDGGSWSELRPIGHPLRIIGFISKALQNPKLEQKKLGGVETEGVEINRSENRRPIIPIVPFL